jgi:pilus assembly protein CpaE
VKEKMKLRGPMNILAVVQSEEVKDSLNNARVENNNVNFDVFVGKVGDVGPEVIDGHGPDVLLLDINLSDSSEVDALGGIIRTYGKSLSVVATSGDATLEGVRRLMRLGVTDFLPQPISDSELTAALEYASRKVGHGDSDEQPRGKVFSYIKPVGGMGATMLAVQSAYCLATMGSKEAQVCLVDLDLQFGNAAVYQDLQSKFSIMDVVLSPGELDGAFLRGVMAHHQSGIDVLTAPLTIEPLDALTPDLVARLLQIASEEYDYVLIDMPQALTDWTQVVLDRSNVVFLVTQLTVAAIRQSRRLLEIMREKGIDEAHTAIVVNRFESRWSREVTVKEAEKALGRQIDYFVPNDYKTVNAALNEGVRLSEIKRGSKVEKRIDALFKSVLKGAGDKALMAQSA